MIPIKSSVTSVNLKKAGMAGRDIVKNKKIQLHLVLISFAAAFGLLVFGIVTTAILEQCFASCRVTRVRHV